jgi:hypothetical protein
LAFDPFESSRKWKMEIGKQKMEGRKWKMESGFARCQARGRTEAERADLRFEIGDYFRALRSAAPLKLAVVGPNSVRPADFRALRGAVAWKPDAENAKSEMEIGK